MKYYLSIALLSLLFCSANAQVGINTNIPESTLDVRVSDPAAPTAEAGIAIPQVTVLPASGNRAGQLLINISDNTFNYYDGSNWVPIYNQVNFIGDLKFGLQTVDHGGWIKMDGRSLSSLSATQKDNAKNLGFLDFIPDGNEIIYKPDSTLTLGEIGGTNSIVLTQNNLPNVTLSGTTSSDGVHSHEIRTKQDDYNLNGTSEFSGPSYGRDNGTLRPTNETELEGEHSHGFDIPLGGVAQPIDVTPRFLNSNSFIFLGN